MEIYDSFDKNLYRISDFPAGSSPAPQKTAEETNGEIENGLGRDLAFVGGRSMVVDQAGSIQAAIDTVYKAGGGDVRLLSTTYKMTDDLILRPGVALHGSGPGTHIDFQGLSFGIKAFGENPYSTGTIAVNDGSSTVTGTGTSWTAAMAGYYILINGVSYIITNVGSGTSLTISPAYFGPNITGNAYVLFSTNNNSSELQIENVTIENSATNAVEIRYVAVTLRFRDSYVLTSAAGIDIQDCQFPLLRNVVVVGMAGNGISMARVGAGIMNECSVVAVGGDALNLNTAKKTSVIDSEFSDAAGNGVTVTNCGGVAFTAVASTRSSGKGIELVSNNNDILFVNCLIEGNASDGIKLTATSDRVSISTSSILNNGGYGINIAASSDDNNYIVAPNFSGNSSGNINDLGTDTTIISQSDSVSFRGTGSDGALSISSGTTTIDLAGAEVLTKNYTSISITGTGKLAFSNPAATGTLVKLKSQGDVTITSSSSSAIDLVGIGAAAGTGGAASQGTGTAGSDGSYILGKTHKGLAGVYGSSSTPGAAIILSDLQASSKLGGSFVPYVIGAGGGGGSGANSGSAPGANGGRGGGALIINCAGALNFTTGSISAAGAVGSTAVQGGGTGGGSGGSGGGGSVFIFYKTLVANSGTLIVSGGTDSAQSGAQGGSTPESGAGGAGGGSVTAGSSGGFGTGNNDGNTGGRGGDGISLVAKASDYF